MLTSEQVIIEAKKKENENLKFRTFLKNHAEEKKLDEQFIDYFLQESQFSMNYETKHKPCDFLMKNGECKLGDCKPESCKKYPYTNQPERLWSLYSVLNVVEVCPVAFEIWERLKKEYGFKAYR